MTTLENGHGREQSSCTGEAPAPLLCPGRPERSCRWGTSHALVGEEAELPRFGPDERAMINQLRAARADGLTMNGRVGCSGGRRLLGEDDLAVDGGARRAEGWLCSLGRRHRRGAGWGRATLPLRGGNDDERPRPFRRYVPSSGAGLGN